ncbi:hypothetical protein SUGI_1017160 [Cryptomeria japonica]|uniref:uncharacterized protein LOC131063826 n=1 Tax=Cryptomeria japonica TaxID=3369 RepID=UPI002414C7EC|nr:uncharacterized protein LOC131063826 [Cryptomeria japonica]GLJ48170.1 hypothetical protein SUGI_1017160 [Cryptomeria japonica]
MQKALFSWTGENKERLKISSLEVALIDEKGVEFKGQGGHRFQLLVPPAIFLPDDDDDDHDDDDLDFFLAYFLGKQDESSKEFEEKLKILNEKIQNVEISRGLKALEAVMDHIINTFADGQQGEIKAAEESDLDKKVEKLVNSGGANRGVLKAVMTEFKNLSRSGLPGISVEIPDESDICKWHVKMDMSLFKDSKGLYQDLQNYAARVSKSRVNKETEKRKDYFSGILLEVSFPNEYPFSPPFVRVLSPKFRFHTGHVTVGGAICTEMLTPSGWLPSLSMETVLVVIQHAIVEGEGRLEMEASASDAHRDYTLEEARLAFQRFAHQHGWIK